MQRLKRKKENYIVQVSDLGWVRVFVKRCTVLGVRRSWARSVSVLKGARRS
jgi:hypothetical protein